jgi:hypothetical protein
MQIIIPDRIRIFAIPKERKIFPVIPYINVAGTHEVSRKLLDVSIQFEDINAF